MTTSAFPGSREDGSTVDIQPAEVWHSETPDNGYGFTTIMSVNTVNDDEEPVHETLLLGSASTIYVSPSNIYVTFTDWSTGSEKTSIHRIHIDEGQIEYHATGEVPGRLLNQFSMDEHGEYFRVATTIGMRRTVAKPTDQQRVCPGSESRHLRPSGEPGTGGADLLSAIHGQPLLPGDLQEGGPPVRH